MVTDYQVRTLTRWFRACDTNGDRRLPLRSWRGTPTRLRSSQIRMG